MSVAGTTSETRIRGRFLADLIGDQPTWPFEVEGGGGGTITNVFIASDLFGVLSCFLDYELVGVMGTSAAPVFYPSAVFHRAVPWGDRVSLGTFGCLEKFSRDILPSKKSKCLAYAEWETVSGVVAAAVEEKEKVEWVRRMTVRRGVAVVAPPDGGGGDAGDPEEWEKILSSGKIVVFRDEGFMLPEVYANLDLCGKVHAKKIEWVLPGSDDGGDDGDTAKIFHADAKTAREIFDEVEGVEGTGGVEKKIKIFGDPRLATGPSIFLRRDGPFSIGSTTTTKKFPKPETWSLASGVGIGGTEAEKKIWVVELGGTSDGFGDDESGVGTTSSSTTTELKFESGVCARTVFVTADEGGMGRAKGMASKATVWGTDPPRFLKSMATRPSVGFWYSERGSPSRKTISKFDAETRTVTVEGGSSSSSMCIGEFWKKYFPATTCFAWDVPVGASIFVLVATHELTVADIVRAFWRSTHGIVVVGKFSASTLEKMLDAW